jgi:ATP-dependent RNA helicase DeaD
MKSFNEIALDDVILKALDDLGFVEPTEIQAQAIPHLLASDQDLIASAQTGTGKTAAFGLPAIQRTNILEKSTQTLVLCPTRELCLQITKDLESYSKYIKGLGIVAVYGGASSDTQIRALNKAAQIVVATPGRAKDLMQRKRLKLDKVRRVVLDEADEMLTMGFKEDLNAILAETPEGKQTLLFSATISPEIVRITKTYMKDPLNISAARRDTRVKNIEHKYYMVHASDRYELLKRIADMNPNIYGIVFCRTRREAKEISHKLMQDNYNADALHGDLSQAQRDAVMERFRNHQLQILVATDVAARGLDVNDLTHVINVNLPDEAEVYVHRSGRTGRAGKSGIAIAIINTREMGKIKRIEQKFGISFQKEMAPTGRDICSKQLIALIDRIEKVQVDEQQIEPFLPAIYKKLDWLSREDLIKHFVSAEFNQFLEYYKGARDLNVAAKPGRKERAGERLRSEDGSIKATRQERRKIDYTRLFINVGAVNGLSPARLIGVVNDALGSRDAAVGNIEIMKKFAFFEIEASRTKELMIGLHDMVFEGVNISVEESQERPKKSDRAEKPFWDKKSKKRVGSEGRSGARRGRKRK